MAGLDRFALYLVKLTLQPLLDFRPLVFQRANFILEIQSDFFMRIEHLFLFGALFSFATQFAL